MLIHHSYELAQFCNVCQRRKVCDGCQLVQLCRDGFTHGWQMVPQMSTWRCKIKLQISQSDGMLLASWKNVSKHINMKSWSLNSTQVCHCKSFQNLQSQLSLAQCLHNDHINNQADRKPFGAHKCTKHPQEIKKTSASSFKRDDHVSSGPEARSLIHVHGGKEALEFSNRHVLKLCETVCHTWTKMYCEGHYVGPASVQQEHI